MNERKIDDVITNEKCLGSVFGGDCVTNLMQKERKIQ